MSREAQMKNNKRSPIVTLITIFSLVLSLCSGILITDKAHAASDQSSSNGSGRDAATNKISPALREGKSGKNGGLVKVLLQIDDKMRGRLNTFFNSYVVLVSMI